MPRTMAELAGYWRWISMHIEFEDGSANLDVYGPAPEGGVVFTPGGRLMAIVTSANRQVPETDKDRIELFKSFSAYTGQARLEGDGRFVTDVDATWDPTWAGMQERFFEINGDMLTVRTAKQTHPLFPEREIRMVGVARRLSD